jgi:prepilin-type N-terminal cleavage/methylation domain-containing protein
MMSRIGNKQRKAYSKKLSAKRYSLNAQQGFSLVEVMVATAVLAFSVVMIYQAFFISLDSFNYCSDYLDVVSWADDKIWTAQDSLSRSGALSQIETQGEFVNNNKKFIWVLSQELLGDQVSLYKINLDLLWRRGKREIKLSRSAYAIYEKKE